MAIDDRRPRHRSGQPHGFQKLRQLVPETAPIEPCLTRLYLFRVLIPPQERQLF
jgi:hypothetical protein